MVYTPINYISSTRYNDYYYSTTLTTKAKFI